MTSKSALVPYSIENQIHLVRGQKVLLDADLAALYCVKVKALNQSVKRNEERFPPDFVFQLSAEENEALRSQTVISKSSRGGRREAYLIEDGKITAPVRDATLIGNGPDALKYVSMVGHDLKLDEGIGTCGKDGQSVPVGVGMPTIKLDKMTVGGTGR
jgi:hypothetical protein